MLYKKYIRHIGQPGILGDWTEKSVAHWKVHSKSKPPHQHTILFIPPNHEVIIIYYTYDYTSWSTIYSIMYYTYVIDNSIILILHEVLYRIPLYVLPMYPPSERHTLPWLRHQSPETRRRAGWAGLTHIYGGFQSHGGTSKSSTLDWDFPWNKLNKPSIWGHPKKLWKAPDVVTNSPHGIFVALLGELMEGRPGWHGYPRSTSSNHLVIFLHSHGIDGP